MKKIAGLFLLFLIAGSVYSDVYGQTERKPKVTIEIDLDPTKFHRPKRNCEKGFWFCKGWIDIDIDIEFKIPATLTLEGDQLSIDFKSSLSEVPTLREENLNELFAEDGEDIEMPERICALFGVSRLVLKPGIYVVDYSKNPFGKAMIKAETTIE